MPYFTKVSCDARPYDLRPVVDTVMAAENWILSRIPKDQPLVILLGEDHQNQMHTLMHQAVLRRHLAQLKTEPARSFALGCEFPRNYREARDPSNDVTRNLHSKISHWLDPEDSDGKEMSKIFSRYEKFCYTKAATSALYRFCRENGISIGFNDVAVVSRVPEQPKREDGKIEINVDAIKPVVDFSHAPTRAIFEKHMPELVGKDVYRFTSPDGTVSVEGIRASNIVMAENAIEHMKRAQARIYVQSVGNGHVLGAETCPYEDSLSAAFKARGFAVLSVVEGPTAKLPAEKPVDIIKVKGLAFVADYTMPYKKLKSVVGIDSAMRFS